MAKQIITPQQEKFLSFFGRQPAFNKKFYLTGGTALAKYYLQHRFSEDLDFFSLKEFDVKDITPLIYQAKKVLGFETIDYQQSFNRHLYFLRFPKGSSLKIEFTYFSFPQLEKPLKKKGVLIDSLKDISVNKVFTIHQNPRGRDFYDLYLILNKQKWTLDSLLKSARYKFDWHLDRLQFGSQLLKVKHLKDDPIIKNQQFDQEKIINFFLKLSQKIGNKSLKK